MVKQTYRGHGAGRGGAAHGGHVIVLAHGSLLFDDKGLLHVSVSQRPARRLHEEGARGELAIYSHWSGAAGETMMPCLEWSSMKQSRKGRGRGSHGLYTEGVVRQRSITGLYQLAVPCSL